MDKKTSPKGRQPIKVHAGRVTLGRCPSRDNDLMCEALNFVRIVDSAGTTTTQYWACACGRRFGAGPSGTPTPPLIVDSRRPAIEMPHWELEDLPDPTEARRWAKAGVVPIGTPVLHSLAVAVPEIDPNLRELAARMLRVMKRCHGIGLAANQVGVPVRMFVHSFDKVLPPVIVNPVIVKSFGKSEDSEGCLSLQVEGSRAAVTRPKVVMTWGTLLNGRRIFVCADELVSRVFQHEIDHLDGLEYVQRLTDREQHRVYETLRANGIDLRWIPPRPY